MLKGYKYRIYPTDEQKQRLARMFGCCRYVYNWALDEREREYRENGVNVTAFDMMRRVRQQLRPQLEWLRQDVSAKALECVVDDLYKGYVNFFQDRARHPKKRKKHGRQHYHDLIDAKSSGMKVDFRRGLLTIPKLKDIPCRFHRRFEGRVRQVAVELLPSGIYRVSLLVDDGKPMPDAAHIDPDLAIGIDTGLKHFAVLSDGQTYETAHYARQERRRMKLLQRRLSKKQQGSRQYRRLKQRIARLHEHIANKRHDRTHKLTHYLAYENQATTICVETLNLEGMAKNRYLAYDMADAGIGEFYSQLEYKCLWAGKNLVRIPRFAPSSRRCSHCGHIYRLLTLNDREWTCPVCGTHHDRDLNAAVNIKHFGLSVKQTLPSVRREVKPVEQPLVDDRSPATAAGPKKPCCCDATRRVREADQQPPLRNRTTSSSGRSRKSEGPPCVRPDAAALAAGGGSST